MKEHSPNKMLKKNEGPFKRKSEQKGKDFSINAPWIGAILMLIAITQVPIAIKTSLDIVCIAKPSNVSNISWCE